ncbi:hypothetical protein ACFW04_014535 [Cataglyphis niger]
MNFKDEARAPHLLHYIGSTFFDVLCVRLVPQSPFETNYDTLVTIYRFGDYLRTVLRNQLVFGLLNKIIQTRLLQIPNLTLDKAVHVTTTMELLKRGAHSNSKGKWKLAWSIQPSDLHCTSNTNVRKSNNKSNSGN